MTGKIRNMINDRGFGFIYDPVSKTDYFFHRSQCLTHWEDLSINDHVEFEIDSSPKGPRAKDVRRADD